MAIMWACKSAKRKLKKGNSVMWCPMSGARFTLSGSQKVRAEGGNVLQLREHPAASPEIKAREWRIAEDAVPPSLYELYQPVQVPHRCNEEPRHKPC